MSVQIPTTEFKYEGKIYQLLVSVGTVDDILLPVDFDSNKKYQMLANENIECLQFENALNQLCLTGSLVYTDVEGYVTDFLNRTNVEVIVDLRRILTTSDGDVSIKNTDEANTFYHVFLVNNIQILSRDGGTIKYQLNLVSKHYNAMIKTLHYTNYNREPEKITDILKALFKKAADGFGDEPMFTLSKTFEEDECASDVKISYATNGNDNMLTASKFLLSRMFYYQQKSQQGRDESMKFLMYDQYRNCYGMLDLGKVDLTNVSNDKLILSMFKTSEEQLAYASENQLATVVSFPQSKYKKLVFGTHTYDYDLLHNTILHEYVTQKTLTRYHDKTDSANITEVEPQTEPKEDPKNADYANQHVYWTNRYTVYQTMTDSLMGSNALVVTTGPNVRRMPSDTIFIAIPPDKSNVTTDSQKAYESVAGRYGQMQGMWIIGKVRNIIFPAQSVYKQNLVLFKNFLTKKEVAD